MEQSSGIEPAGSSGSEQAVASTDEAADRGGEEQPADDSQLYGAEEASDGSSIDDSAAIPPARPSLLPLTATLAVTIGHPLVSGPAEWAQDAPVSLRLLDTAGEELGSGRGAPRRGELRWEAILRDTEGDDVYPRPGDVLVLEYTPDDTPESWPLPTFDMQFDRIAGLMTGRSAPGASVMLAPPEGDPVATLALADGSFALDAGPGAGLKGGASIVAAVVDPSGRALLVDRPVPYVRVSLHPGDVTGSARPLGIVTFRLLGTDGEIRGIGAAQADPTGRFTAWIRNDRGHRVRPHSGDRLEIEDADGKREMVVPPLQATHDLEADALSGVAEPDTQIRVTLWNPWRPGELDNPEITVDADGSWQIDADIDVLPASHYYVTEVLPDGDQAYYCYQVPLLAVMPGTPWVRAEALWEVTATLGLERQGQIVARAEGGGEWSGNVDLVLRDAQGSPVTIEADDRVLATVDGVSVTMTVPPLSAELSPGDGSRGPMAIGRAEPDAELILAREIPLDISADARGDGTFELDLPPARDLSDRSDITWLGNNGVPEPAPGSILQLVHEQADGHHVRRRWIGPTVEVELGQGVRGTVAPASELTLRVRPTDPNPELAGASIAGETGAFAWTTMDALGETPVAGDLVSVDSGEWLLERDVPILSIEHFGGTFAGIGPADEVLELRLRPLGAPTDESRTMFTDEDGAWRFDLAADVDLSRGPSSASTEGDFTELGRVEIVFTDRPWTFRTRLDSR